MNRRERNGTQRGRRKVVGNGDGPIPATRVFAREPGPCLDRLDPLVSVLEAAVRLGLAPQTVRNWLSLRKLPCVKIGRLTRIPQSALDQYIAINTIPAVNEGEP
jgi:excisionase family DNA binding protein